MFKCETLGTRCIPDPGYGKDCLLAGGPIPTTNGKQEIALTVVIFPKAVWCRSSQVCRRLLDSNSGDRNRRNYSIGLNLRQLRGRQCNNVGVRYFGEGV